MPKYIVVVEYIGTNYAGSQIQPDKITIQSERALGTLIKSEENPSGRIKTIFSGRTDAGVHAKGQVVHFVSEKPIVASRFLNSLNGLLPEDISVSSIKEVPDDFHAQKSGRYRRYQYRIANRSQRSVWDSHSLLVRKPLNVARMNEALSFLLGEHDFITIEIVANRFLYNMVRTIVGTLLMIEHKNLKPGLMGEILEAKDRTKAGPTISPDGLTLVEVGYAPYQSENPSSF